MHEQESKDFFQFQYLGYQFFFLCVFLSLRTVRAMKSDVSGLPKDILRVSQNHTKVIETASFEYLGQSPRAN